MEALGAHRVGKLRGEGGGPEGLGTWPLSGLGKRKAGIAWPGFDGSTRRFSSGDRCQRFVECSYHVNLGKDVSGGD